MPLFQRIMRGAPYGLALLSRAPKSFVPASAPARVNGLPTTLNLREGIQRSIFFDVYEPTQTAWFRECAMPGMTVVDVGASFGYYTSLAASLVSPAGKVYAFEPSPVAARSIEEMIAGSAGNIILTKAAVGREKGSIDLFMPTTEHLHSPSILASDPDFVPLNIDVVTLDDFADAQGIETIHLIKMDVEGYEPDVLAGMTRLLREKRVHNIFCEFNSGWLKRNGTTPQELLDTFLAAGCTVKRRTKLLTDLPERGGDTFSLQDMWLTLG